MRICKALEGWICVAFVVDGLKMSEILRTSANKNFSIRSVHSNDGNLTESYRATLDRPTDRRSMMFPPTLPPIFSRPL